ncbi:Abscission/NoCut checkpoint regulator [Tolypocladium ophioglossoides CBS 100239]|uniref:Abscission/NoCut checkpoint regulator n=1 Tax=Tolypocladium ophioglossoides (strain CBS 100239) TaxID=1163406 RepID=A0A0L0MZK1_TOLOC|nr:Abscission/NoCut checkpoint regulator [Tolypocladium ophioglossoides CBS 100239]
MPNDIDKSLLDRLQALRGSSATPERPAPTQIQIDVIERAKTPTREDALAARLKSLREHAASPSSTPARDSPKTDESRSRSTSAQAPGNGDGVTAREEPGDDAVDAVFETDDQTLEELLGDVDAAEEQPPPGEPRDEDVRALLEQLSQSVPKDHETGDHEGHSDDSDGEKMNREVDHVLARFRDEAEVDAALGQGNPPREDEEEGEEEQEQERQPTDEPSDDIPSLPPNLDDLPSISPSHPPSTALDDLTARMAALRAPASDVLPSVPTSKPAGKPVKRLTSTTAYADDDVDSWCTVCLEDATLRCLGCDDDPYCARCWREMHVGPAAGFDERSHRAVQFTRSRKKEGKPRVALGAS